MIEDNGGTREVQADDPWLASMISRMDDIIGHLDNNLAILTRKSGSKQQQAT